MFRLAPSPRALLGRGWWVQRPRANKPHKTPKWSFLLGSTLCKHPPSCLPLCFPSCLFSGSDKSPSALGPTFVLLARGRRGEKVAARAVPGLGPPRRGEGSTRGRGGGRAGDEEKSGRRHRLWLRRRGKHLSGPERNINKRTPARAPTAARLRQLWPLPALKARPVPLPPPPPLPLLPSPAT